MLTVCAGVLISTRVSSDWFSRIRFKLKVASKTFPSASVDRGLGYALDTYPAHGPVE